MIRGQKFILALILLIVGFISFTPLTMAQTPVVRAVLFYSPSCPHCKEVIEELLPELDKKYGSQLQIFGVNTYTEQGAALYGTYVEAYQVPSEMQGVPALVVGDQYMVGSGEIPARFPDIIEAGLAAGGIDWPPIEGLTEAMERAANPQSDQTTEITQGLTLKDKFMGDLAGNVLAVIVLAGMLGAVAYAGIKLNSMAARPRSFAASWLIPVLSLVGIGIAGYLSYVELNQVEAVCGPVGNCNTVQQSSYATLFGILPVGVMGVLGYLAIIIAWLAGKLDLSRYNRLIKMALWLFTLIGTLFSIYLTFLEPFVIGATCIWCLSSAVIMTVLFLLATKQLNEPDQS